MLSLASSVHSHSWRSSGATPCCARRRERERELLCWRAPGRQRCESVKEAENAGDQVRLAPVRRASRSLAARWTVMIHANDWTAKVERGEGETWEALQAQVGKGLLSGFATVHDHLPHSTVSPHRNAVPLQNAAACHLLILPSCLRLVGRCRCRLT